MSPLLVNVGSLFTHEEGELREAAAVVVGFGKFELIVT
jgi:hypothetical protein